jgi:hypothetical protein
MANNVHRLAEISKIFFSETTWPIGTKLGMSIH